MQGICYVGRNSTTIKVKSVGGVLTAAQDNCRLGDSAERGDLPLLGNELLCRLQNLLSLGRDIQDVLYAIPLGDGVLIYGAEVVDHTAI